MKKSWSILMVTWFFFNFMDELSVGVVSWETAIARWPEPVSESGDSRVSFWLGQAVGGLSMYL